MAGIGIGQTLQELISDLRNTRYGGIFNDDSAMPDGLLAEWIHTKRAYVVRQDLNKGRMMPPQLEQDLGCVPLECASAVECCDIPIGISSDLVIKRTPELPQPIYFDGAADRVVSQFTYVGEIDRQTAIELTTTPIAIRSRYLKWTSRLRRAYYLNKRLYVVNAGMLEHINVRGVFEDPTDVVLFKTCAGEPCYSDDMPYPMTLPLWNIARQMIMDVEMKQWVRDNNKEEDNDAQDRSVGEP